MVRVFSVVGLGGYKISILNSNDSLKGLCCSHCTQACSYIARQISQRSLIVIPTMILSESFQKCNTVTHFGRENWHKFKKNLIFPSFSRQIPAKDFTVKYRTTARISVLPTFRIPWVFVKWPVQVGGRLSVSQNPMSIFKCKNMLNTL